MAHVEVGSTLKLNRKISLQSLYRRKNSCSGGNLLKIHTHRCTNGLCNVTLDGSSTTMTKTSKWCYIAVGAVVASWLVRSSLGRAARVRALAGVIALCHVRGHCVGQDTFLSQCLSPPRCINGYRRI